ncbi:helix-turn-helix domain-containing protein [Nocardioides nanhaiensis]|uniref:AraC family transcriptional regulator n=1 Tax=Nocardioides nanhaiensis TaxID=1476871 RepID=A0ABP8WQJ5_9ACTN
MHPALRPHLDSLVVYDVDLGGPGVQIGMPAPTGTVVLPLEERLDVGWAGAESTRVSSWATTSGLALRPAEIRHGERQVGVQLALTLTGARALLGVPAAELAGRMVDLGDVDPALRHLPEQLAGAPRQRRSDVVVAALLGALERHGGYAPRPEVGRSLALLTRGAGVQQVADEVGYSRRHLRDLVVAESGLPPQQVLRLARFARSHRLARDPARPLETVAAEAGYSDQSHLTRDWRELAGVGPGEWRRRELPFVQDAVVDVLPG